MSQEFTEADVREFLAALMPLEHAPAHVRLAFHDAGTYDAPSSSGGANGSVHLAEELSRSENAGWAKACIELLAEASTQYPSLSWADLVAVAAAAAIQKSGGPVIEVGLGRADSDAPALSHRLPGGYEGSHLLRRLFANLGLGPRELVALAGAHTLGHAQRRPITGDPWVFSNSYFVELLSIDDPGRLQSDLALLRDPELRQFVETYAADEQRFFADFADALRRLTWVGVRARLEPIMTEH